MDKKKAICEYLRKNHVGKENAIHSKELEKLFLLDGRNIRRKMIDGQVFEIRYKQID